MTTTLFGTGIAITGTLRKIIAGRRFNYDLQLANRSVYQLDDSTFVKIS